MRKTKDNGSYVEYSETPLELPNGEVVLFKIEDIFRPDKVSDNDLIDLFKEVEDEINTKILIETKKNRLYEFYPHFYFAIEKNDKNFNLMTSFFNMKRVDVLKIMLYPGKELNKQVVYTIDPTCSLSVLKDMLEKACMAGVTKVTVYLSTFEDESYVKNVDGVTMSGNHQFKYSAIEGVIVTKQTIKNIKEPLHFVIAAGIDESNLQVLEDRKDVLAVVVINEDIANIDGWLKLYDAKNANTGERRMQGMVVEPLLNKVIGWLKYISEGSTPLYDSKRDDYLREAANLLKRNRVGYSEDVVAAQCIKRGLDAKSARAIASVFEKAIKSRGDLPVKNGNPNYSAMLDMVDDEKFERN